ncbi:MAG: hypothetical protein AAB865_01495 [Patescibacteria group bacterium]
MSKTPNFDTKLKAMLVAEQIGERTCAISGEKWQFDEREMRWCRQFNTPVSRYSPLTRLKWLSAFRTSFEIFWNKHAFTGEPILTYVHPDIKTPIVSDQEWHNLDVGSMPEYQREVDLTRPMLDQFRDLVSVVPMGARREWKNIVNTVGVGMWDVEDCYIVFSTVGTKRAMYTYYCLEGSEDITQSVFVRTSQSCFGSTHIDRCHSCTVAVESRDCINCAFIFDCRNCEDCFGASNLRNKKYVFFNEQLTKEQYQERMKSIDLSCRSTYKEYYQRFIDLIGSAAFPENFNMNSGDSNGEYLTDCVRVTDSYYMNKCTDCAYNYGSGGAEGCYYLSSAYPATNSWMCAVLLDCSNVKYSAMCGKSRELEYCYNCHDSEYCFGSVGLRNKKFHIFNRPYSEEEYWKKVDELKCAMLDRGEYGEYFPLDLSPNGMQFSMTPILYDVEVDEMKKFNAPMYDPDRGAVLAPKKTVEEAPLNSADVPDCLKDVDPSLWVAKPFMDQKVNRRWTVVPKEFEFYRSHNLPFPEEHYTSRLRRQIQMMNLPLREVVNCAACHKSITVGKNKTFTARKVYCTDCYLKYLETK